MQAIAGPAHGFNAGLRSDTELQLYDKLTITQCAVCVSFCHPKEDHHITSALHIMCAIKAQKLLEYYH